MENWHPAAAVRVMRGGGYFVVVNLEPGPQIATLRMGAGRVDFVVAHFEPGPRKGADMALGFSVVVGGVDKLASDSELRQARIRASAVMGAVKVHRLSIQKGLV